MLYGYVEYRRTLMNIEDGFARGLRWMERENRADAASTTRAATT